jgi:hypothetical protein
MYNPTYDAEYSGCRKMLSTRLCSEGFSSFPITGSDTGKGLAVRIPSSIRGTIFGGNTYTLPFKIKFPIWELSRIFAIK